MFDHLEAVSSNHLMPLLLHKVIVARDKTPKRVCR